MSAEFSPQVRGVVHARSEFVCEMCGRKPAVEHHHRRNRGGGGTKRLDSATASACLHLCRHCHRLIGSEPDLSFTCGWLVSQYDSPLSTPVVYRGSPVLLDDLGNMREAT